MNEINVPDAFWKRGNKTMDGGGGTDIKCQG
jgi:hypothetical protein